MKRVSSWVAVLMCFTAGSVIASTQMTQASKVQRFANPELCFLETAATESDSVLVRDELVRRDVQCTPELRSVGRASLEQSLKDAQFRQVGLRQDRQLVAREMAERRETQRLIRCTANPGDAGCRNGY